MIAEQRIFKHDDLDLAGQLWGQGEVKILALHGWLDNAASFDALAQSLLEARPQYQLFALDLPGHGHSDHKPASGNYAIWDDLRSVLGVVDALGWEQFYLLGHSRGAMMSSLFAGALPERVRGLICLDGLVAEPATEQDISVQLGKYLRDYSRPQTQSRGFSSLEEAAQARIKAMPMQQCSALKIVERGTRTAADGRYYWRSDRRLILASPVKLTLEQWRQAARVSVPAMFAYAEQGFGKHIMKMVPELDQYFEIVSCPGDHHFHMDVAVEEIAQLVDRFIKTTEHSVGS